MSVIISSNYVIADTVSGGGTITADNPIVGWENRVTVSNLSTTTEDASYPASNLANTSTNLRWKGLISSPEADEYITLALNTAEDVDYIGIAKHNFGTAGIVVSVEVTDNGSPEAWSEVVSETMFANDSPIILRFTPQAVTSIRLRLQPGTAAPTAAVIYAGKLLVMQRKIQVGHTPINYGRSTRVVNARSESGNFLGRIVLSRSTSTSVDMKNLTPEWYRTYVEPWLVNAQEEPFFFAWKPSTYPREVGFAWLTNDPKPVNQLANGMLSFGFNMSGVV
jgi:hypothetical protein